MLAPASQVRRPLHLLSLSFDLLLFFESWSFVFLLVSCAFFLSCPASSIVSLLPFSFLSYLNGLSTLASWQKNSSLAAGVIFGEEAALEKIPMGDVALWVRRSTLFHCAREGMLPGLDEDFVNFILPEKLFIFSIPYSSPFHHLIFLLIRNNFFFSLHGRNIKMCCAVTFKNVVILVTRN